jgi:hypothetical protein
MGTPRDFCEAEYLRDRAKHAGFYIDGGWGAISLRALPVTVKRFGLVPQAELFRADSIEAALGWLAGWGDRGMFDSVKRTKRAKRSKEARRV